MENFERIDSHWINLDSPWKMIRGKYLFENPKILNKDSKEKNLLSLTLNGVLKKDMDSSGGLRPDSYDSYQIFYENDLVFKLIDLENVKTSRVGWVHERGLMSPVYIRLKPKEDKINTRYFYYYFFDLYQRQIFNSIGSGIRSSLTGT
jgi:type I restriction enzyme S subunit